MKIDFSNSTIKYGILWLFCFKICEDFLTNLKFKCYEEGKKKIFNLIYLPSAAFFVSLTTLIVMYYFIIPKSKFSFFFMFLALIGIIVNVLLRKSKKENIFFK